MNRDAPELPELFALRQFNPLVVYGAPWKRGRFLACSWFALVCGSIVACIALTLLQSSTNHWYLATLVLPPPLLTIALLSFMAERREERLQEYYLARLSREEVVFGSFYWGAMTAALLVPIWTLGFIGTMMQTREWQVGLLGGPFVGMMWAIAVTKGLRLCLAARRHHWTIIFTTPLAMLVDLAVAGTVGATVMSLLSRQFLHADPITLTLAGASALVTLAAMIFWNLHVAVSWAVALYYREIDGVTARQLFLPTPSDRRMIAELLGLAAPR